MMRAFVVLLALCAATGEAQQPAPAEVFGSVTVHVICGDTNQPARLSSVTLQPVGEEIPMVTGPPGAPKSGTTAAGTNITTYKTGLDGAVIMPRVVPGRYYVVVQHSGYLSPVAQFSREDMNHPDESTRKEIENSIPVVVVAAQQSSPVTVRLVHAATITGTLRYDDGAPVPLTTVFAYHRGRNGDWVAPRTESYARSDDQGHYRISGLAPGEYRVESVLELTSTTGSNVFSFASTRSKFGYSLTFYFGDTIRAADAKTFKVGEGENSAGNDITIPVARLHSVSGTLVDARNGAVLNSGRVALYLGDDKIPSATAWLQSDDPTFRFDFVLEGEYTLKVSHAGLVRREDIVPAKGEAFNAYAPKFKDVPLKAYGDYAAPFTVRTDTTGVTLTIPEAQPKPAKK